MTHPATSRRKPRPERSKRGVTPPGTAVILAREPFLRRWEKSAMFSLDDRPYALCDRLSRRELMRIGGLNLLGLTLPGLLSARAQAAAAGGDALFGRAKNVIYLWLQ